MLTFSNEGGYNLFQTVKHKLETIIEIIFVFSSFFKVSELKIEKLFIKSSLVCSYYQVRCHVSVPNKLTRFIECDLKEDKGGIKYQSFHLIIVILF